MRILDQDNNKPINRVLLMLTPTEAKELVDSIPQLTVEKGDHTHINDETYHREITIAIYTSANVHSFAPAIVDLIENEI